VRKVDAVCALLLIALAILVMAEGLRLGIGWGTDGPQSGFVPFWLGFGLAVSGLIILLQTGISRVAASSRSFIEPGKFTPVIKVLAPATGMVVLTHFLGLYVVGGLYMGIYMRWIGRHSWFAVFVLSLAIPITTFLIFEIWFLVPMPKGPLEAFLGY
jgi:hypothetical protein